MKHLLPLTVLLLAACSTTPPESQPTSKTESEQTDPSEPVQVKEYKLGTVVDKRNLDGCTYLIELVTGETLDPVNLPEQYRKDQLSVSLRYEAVENKMNTCMAGKMVRIHEIKTTN